MTGDRSLPEVEIHGSGSAGPRRSICLISSVASTLRVFYWPLFQALGRSGFDVSLICSDGPELPDFERLGLARVYRVPITRSITPVRDLAAVITLFRLLRRHRFDLIHTHTPKAGLLGMTAGWLARVPARVHTLHGTLLETARGLRRLVLVATERLTLLLAHRVCVVSKSLREKALELGLCPPDKAIILGEGKACGVDFSRFERTTRVEEEARAVRRAHGIPGEAIVIGFVGWLVADKGVAELVDAFTALAERRDNLYLLMIGADGRDRDPLPERTYAAIRQHPRIRYAGLVAEPAPY
ncbi:MAG: glycosyltransferase [Planctomycetota bacterium]